ncbi:MAG TPA: PDZ domain-containing protein [Bacteroidales bacterium]|nr:PDZ domain-containing protein [Bacteroidales bacterium]
MKRFSGKIFGSAKHFWWLTALLPVFWLFTGGSRQNDFEISKNLDIFATVFRQLNANYADEINPGKLTKTAIDAMLGSLDPFTVYLPESDIEDYRITQAGQSGSAGFQVMLREGRYIVVAMNNGGAAAEQGIRIGDELTTVEKRGLAGKSAEEVNQLLSGQAGSKVEITLKRPYTDETFDFALERRFIK